MSMYSPSLSHSKQSMPRAQHLVPCTSSSSLLICLVPLPRLLLPCLPCGGPNSVGRLEASFIFSKSHPRGLAAPEAVKLLDLW